MIEQINHIAQLWWSGTVAMFWQVGVLIILIGCVDLIIRRWAWPQLRYALWLMVLVKLVLPPTISLSTSVTSRLEPLARQIVAKENHRENLNAMTAMIFANLQATVAETPAEVIPSRDVVTEQRPAVVVAGSEDVAGESPNTNYVKPVWQAYAMAVWLAGMFVLGGWLILKFVHLRREDRRLATRASLPESFYDATARCAKSLGLRRAPKVVLTRKVACPAVFGVVRPVLLMPAGYLSRMTRKDTVHMLLHEFAHIKRGDLWVHGFYMLLQVIYWYNPLLWLVRRQMHHLRELCCDATVARLLRERISEYRQTLIDVARRFLTKPTEPGLGLLGLFEDSNRLLVRLNWLKKETWRYQKMKKVTIITTIVLMLAFVLPMARAQDKPATENSSTDPIKVEVQPSQTPETIEAGQDENEAQAQLLQAKQALQTQLQQLEIQKQKLQQQLQALTQAKQAEIQARQAEIQARQAKVKDKAVKVKASAEAHKAETEAEHWEQYAKKIEAWARQYEAQMNSPEVQERYKLLADNWVNSDQFKQWQKDMEQWSKEYAKAHKEYIEAHKEYTEGHKEYTEGHVQTESDDHDHTSAPDHPMHVMPPMPPMPAMPPMLAEILTPDVVAQAPMALPVTIAPAPPQPLTVVVPKVEPPAEIAAPAPVLPNITGAPSGSTPNIKIEKDKDGKFNATKEMHFVAKVKPGIPLVVRNSLGNIILKPGKEDICDVRAVISGKDKNQAKARAMIEQVSMNLHSTDERYYLKPVKSDGGQWSNLSVDFYITVPTGILPDVKTDLGNIEISNLQGKIKAVTDLGAIKAVNTTGEIDLFTSMGNIEFVAPRDLSAKLMVQTKMGEIKSELPLEINRADMFKRTTEGTIGAGGSTIKMATDMGKINLKWQSSPQVEVKL